LNSNNGIKSIDLPYNSIDYIRNNYDYSQDYISNDDELQLSDLNIIEHDIEGELKQNYDDSSPILKNEPVIVNNIEIENIVPTKYQPQLHNELIPKKGNNSKIENIYNDKNIVKLNSKIISSKLSYNQYKYLLNNQWNHLQCQVFEYKGKEISFEELRAMMNGYPLKIEKDISSEYESDMDMDIDHDNNDEMFEEIFTNISASISNNSKGSNPERNSIFQNVNLNSKKNRFNSNKSSFNNNLTFNIDPKYYETMNIDKYNKEDLGK